MINPFISIDQQLIDAEWAKVYEGTTGFIFAKPLGSEYFIKAEYEHGHIKFYDPLANGDNSKGVNEKELLLFAAKIKEWRKIHECSNKSGRHFSKE